jgi:hypothetical protein
VPAVRGYFDSLGLSPFDVLKATNGTIKLAIEFYGWRGKGDSFMHPFGRYGLEAGRQPARGFHRVALRGQRTRGRRRDAAPHREFLRLAGALA